MLPSISSIFRQMRHIPSKQILGRFEVRFSIPWHNHIMITNANFVFKKRINPISVFVAHCVSYNKCGEITQHHKTKWRLTKKIIACKPLQDNPNFRFSNRVSKISINFPHFKGETHCMMLVLISKLFLGRKLLVCSLIWFILNWKGSSGVKTGI